MSSGELGRFDVSIQAALQFLLDALEQMRLRRHHPAAEKNARRSRGENHGVQQLSEAMNHEIPRGMIGRQLRCRPPCPRWSGPRWSAADAGFEDVETCRYIVRVEPLVTRDASGRTCARTLLGSRGRRPLAYAEPSSPGRIAQR